MARILIAEDDPISQKLALGFIENMGHTAVVSPHGKNAYELLLAANDFDILVTDIMMPEMDGAQLIQTLRGDSRFMNLPIIIMSAVVGVADISDLLALGATFFLSKPLMYDEFKEYVDKSLTAPGPF